MFKITEDSKKSLEDFLAEVFNTTDNFSFLDSLFKCSAA